jgi:hypothetical protein
MPERIARSTMYRSQVTRQRLCQSLNNITAVMHCHATWDQSWRGSAVRGHLLLIQASFIATDTNKLSQPYFKSTRILSQMRGEHVGGAHPGASL